METHIPVTLNSDIAVLILMFICICFVVFLNISEAALMTSNKLKIKHLAEKNVKSAKTVLKITENYDKLFGTMSATLNLFIILATSLGTVLAVNYFGFGGVVWVTLGMTIFIVLFGEITPKTYAASKPEKMSLFVAGPIDKIIKLTSPVISIFIAVSGFFVKLLGASPKVKPYLLTEDEIKTAIDVVSKEGIFHSDKRDMLYGVFRFAETIAEEVMTPRVDMVCIESGSNLNQIIDIIKQTGHSRIPIYEGNIDNITGVVYAKDLLNFSDEELKNLSAKDMARKAVFIPASQKVFKLLTELRANKNTMAIIIDEFGGTAGLVTIELLLEEIVGDIQDEYDIEQMVFQKVDTHTFIVSAKTDVFELNKKLSLKLPEGQYNTLAGFIIDFLGRIPKEGELFEYNNIKFKVISVKKNKLEVVEIQLPAK